MRTPARFRATVPRRGLPGSVTLICVLAVTGCGGGGSTGATTSQPYPESHRSGGPNIIVVTTDDQTVGQFNRRSMPFTWRFFQHHGTFFTNSVAAPPLCCPSRAGFLTGEYPHSSGVFGNAPGYATLRDKENVLPAWLDRAGYETGFVGKYLNGYPGQSEPAPGWDSWFGIVGVDDYFDYDVSVDGDVRHYGDSRSDYSTDVLTNRAVDFIRESGHQRAPYFLWLAYNAPHLIPGGYPPPCDGDSPQPPSDAAFRPYAHKQLPHPPDFDERNIADKPAWFQHLRPLTTAELKQMTTRWRCNLAAVKEVDVQMRRLVGTLRSEGRLQNTIVVFDSDNGYFFGEHRIDDDKRLPYEPSLRVPLAIAVPSQWRGGDRPRRVREPVANVDLPATLLDYADAKPCIGDRDCRVVDGRSLHALIAGQDPGWAKRRAILVELDDAYTYEAARTSRYLYVELTASRQGPLSHPAIELYDLKTDPYELRNLAHAGKRTAEVQDRLARRLRSLEDCHGSPAYAPRPSRAC